MQELGELNAKQAAGSPAARAALQKATGRTAQGISRRLNAAHGAEKVRNLFPAAFEESDDDEESERLDYEAIGNLTVREAREYEFAEDIARLTNLSTLAVTRRLNSLSGNGIIRRQFSWYEASTIAELTVRTALDCGLVPVLTRAFRRRRSTIEQLLGAAAGQTKLRNVFDELSE